MSGKQFFAHVEPPQPVSCCIATAERLRDAIRKAWDEWEENGDDTRDGCEVVMDEFNRIVYGTPPAGKQ